MIELFHAAPADYVEGHTSKTINIDLFDDGVHQTEDFLIFREGAMIKFFDRDCDHNKGRLSLSGGIARCPLHGWRFDVRSGSYLNAQCAKEPLIILYEHELDSPLVEVPIKKERLALQPLTKRYRTTIRYLNHACLHFEIDNKIRFATDPWLMGPAFSNGWWLSQPSPEDSLNVVNDCHFIFISHNHPDHLHAPTLANIRRDMPILTAAFNSGSTVRYLKTLGFENIVAPEFGHLLRHPEEELALCVLKSGDFRDDSGLLVQSGEFTALLTVDSNFLDFMRFPKKIDLLCSSFAGGATGFPLCFDNYSEEEKRRTVLRNRNAVKANNLLSMEQCSPTYFMPYAGFFSEAALRDRYVKDRNLKNSVLDYVDVCERAGNELLNVLDADCYEFVGKDLEQSRALQIPRLNADKPETIIAEQRAYTEVLTDRQIESYFLNSQFYDDLVLELKLCDDEFECSLRQFFIEFDPIESPKFLTPIDFQWGLDGNKQIGGKRFLSVKVREVELYNVVANGLPWEDLSIGFQLRVRRQPDVYNNRFWDHFTNVYTNDSVVS